MSGSGPGEHVPSLSCFGYSTCSEDGARLGMWGMALWRLIA